MKTHLPKGLRAALLAAIAAVPMSMYSAGAAVVAVPGSYDDVAVEVTGNTEPVELSHHTSITGGAVYSISFGTAYPDGSLTISNNSASVSFLSNSVERGDGGAIWLDGPAVAKHNAELVFADNHSAYFDGGALYVQGTALLADNASVTFANNGAGRDGGALQVMGPFLTMERNDLLKFEGNIAARNGGAVRAGGRDFKMSINNNGEVIFINNQSTEAANANEGGGAIAAIETGYSPSFEMVGNETVRFTGNTTTNKGGACLFNFANGGTAIFRDNTSLEFSGNTSGSVGGAVALSRNATGVFENNDRLSFTANVAGGRGGAIGVYQAAYISIINNGEVLFRNNSAVGGGGAIGVSHELTIAGNRGDVIFSGNYIRCEDEEAGPAGSLVLNSISSTPSYGTDVTLAAEDGTKLAFYDAVNLQGSGSTRADFNLYEDGATGGTVLFSGKDSEATLRFIWEEAGQTLEGETFEAALAASRYSVVSNQSITLHGGTLAVEDDAVLQLDSYNCVQALKGATIRLSDAALIVNASKGGVTDLFMEEGSTLAVAGAPSLVVAETLALGGATLDYGSSAAGSRLSVDGSLSLDNASVFYRAESVAEGGEIWGEGVNVNGTLTATGTTTVVFVSAANARPDGSYTLFTCDSFQGELKDWVLQSGSVWGDGVAVNGALEGAVLEESTTADGGRAAIVMTVTQDQPDVPTPDLGILHVPTGVNESIDNLDRKVSMEGGVLDASGVPAEETLGNDVIRGYAGQVLTTEAQSVLVTGTETVGYGIDAATGHDYGASLAIGVAGGDAASAHVKLDGASYNLSSLSVLGGQATVGEASYVGLPFDDAVMPVVVGSENGRASLTNNGTIYASTVEVKKDSSLTNKGRLVSRGGISLAAGSALRNEDEVTIGAGECLQVSGVLNNNGTVDGRVDVADGGVVKGQGSITEVHMATGSFVGAVDAATKQVIDNLSVEQGATLGFFVQPNAQAGSSSLQVGSLTLLGSPEVAIRLGGQMAAAEGQSFHITLMEAANVEENGGSIGSYTLSGMTQLVEADSVELVWDAAAGTLSLSGNLASVAVANAAAADASRLADTLWSSTGTVASFARTAASQARWLGAQGVQFWAAGLGDFMSMGGENGLSGFDYSGGGYAVGGSVRVAEGSVVGAAVGQMFGSHKTDDNLLNDKQRATMFSVYGVAAVSAGKNPVLLSADFGYGSVSHTADTHVGGDAATPGRAKWDDDVFTFGLQAEKKMELSESLALTPFVGLRYIYGGQDDMIETFAGGSRDFRGGSLQSWSIPVGVTLSSVCSLGSAQKLLPYLTVAYVGDVARRDPKTGVTAAGESLGGRGHTPGRNGLMTRTGVTWLLSDTWAVGADYHLEVRSGQVNQDVNLHVNYSF